MIVQNIMVITKTITMIIIVSSNNMYNSNEDNDYWKKNNMQW